MSQIDRKNGANWLAVKRLWAGIFFCGCWVGRCVGNVEGAGKCAGRSGQNGVIGQHNFDPKRDPAETQCKRHAQDTAKSAGNPAKNPAKNRSERESMFPCVDACCGDGSTRMCMRWAGSAWRPTRMRLRWSLDQRACAHVGASTNAHAPALELGPFRQIFDIYPPKGGVPLRPPIYYI